MYNSPTAPRAQAATRPQHLRSRPSPRRIRPWRHIEPNWKLLGDLIAKEVERIIPQQPISVLKLSGRASGILLDAKIGTVNQLVQESRRSLLRLPNCGARAVEEIVAALDRCGLRLLGE